MRCRPAACLLASLALPLYLNLLYSLTSSFLHLLPTGASLAGLWRLAAAGIQDTQRYAAPVPGLRGIELIATAGIGLVAIVTDLVAVRLRRCALAGLPLLVLFSIPVATGAGKNTFADAVVFCLGMAGYLALLSADGQERLRLWGRLVTPWNAGHDDEDDAAGELGSGPSIRALAASGRRVGLAAVVLALFVPLLVPSLHAHKLFPSSHEGLGLGSGPGIAQAPDPLVLMNRQLNEAKPTEVLSYHTTDPDPQYLQLAVLGTLNDSGWTLTTERGDHLSGSPATLPPVPGLATPQRWPAEQTTIHVKTGALPADSFLPVPYAPRQLDSPGSWVADPSTLALYSGSQQVSGLSYSVASVNVAPLRDQVDQAPAGTGSLRQYLVVPPSYDSLRSYAEAAVGNAATPGEKAIALDKWFTSGLFRYTLNVGGPSGAGRASSTS